MGWIKTYRRWSYSTCPADQQGTPGLLLDGRCVGVSPDHLFRIGVKFWCFGEHHFRLKLDGFHTSTSFSLRVCISTCWNTGYRQPVCNSENEKRGKLMLHLQTVKWILLGVVGARRITSQTPIRHEGLFCIILMEVCLFILQKKRQNRCCAMNWYCGVFLIQFCQLAYWVRRSVDVSNAGVL